MANEPLVILAHVRHAAVTEGFLPAAQRLGLPVVLVTDHRLDHLEHFTHATAHAPQQVLECDVFSPLGVIDLLEDRGIRPAAVFSNSDHLQTSAALVAAHFGLPGKDWRVCYAAKNKAAMRARSRALGLPHPWFHALADGAPVPGDVPYPVVAKPREGVAGLDVRMCASGDALEDYLASFRQRRPGRTILLEGFLDGPLFSLETLGDGRSLRAVGGFDTRVSAPPHFIELESVWNGPHVRRWKEQALAQLAALGVGFGACHGEFALTERGPVLVEINYRSIGDGCEFMLDQLFDGRWFEWILRLHRGERLDHAAIDRAIARDRHALLRFYVAEQEGRLANVAAPRIDPTAQLHAAWRPLRAAGDTIQLSRSNKDYLGVLSVADHDADSLAQRVAALEAQLDWTIEPLERTA